MIKNDNDNNNKLEQYLNIKDIELQSNGNISPSKEKDKKFFNNDKKQKKNGMVSKIA